MAAVFIGGTSIAGGNGVIVGTVFGAYIIGSLEAGVVATGIGGYWVQLVEGSSWPHPSSSTSSSVRAGSRCFRAPCASGAVPDRQAQVDKPRRRRGKSFSCGTGGSLR